VLLFYPFDFTFVCPTELIAFSDRHDEFTARGAQVIGSRWCELFVFSFVLLLRLSAASALVTFICVLCTLCTQISRSIRTFTHYIKQSHDQYATLHTSVSTDSHHTHLAWSKTKRSDGGVGELAFPLVADISKDISMMYGKFNHACRFCQSFLAFLISFFLTLPGKFNHSCRFCQSFLAFALLSNTYSLLTCPLFTLPIKGVLVDDPADEMYGAALRGLFIIDPAGTVRSALINDDHVGRSVDET
jgi:alkyl hydroperoxide reductase subunit AhpC